MLEGLVVDLQLVLDLFLLSHEVFVGERAQVFALDFLAVQAEFSARLLVLDFGLDHQPCAQGVVADLARLDHRHRVYIRRLLAEARLPWNLAFVLSHLRG